jgi:hypothetical protein
MRKVNYWKNKLYLVVNVKENVDIVGKLGRSHFSARTIRTTMWEITETEPEPEQIFAGTFANRAMSYYQENLVFCLQPPPKTILKIRQGLALQQILVFCLQPPPKTILKIRQGLALQQSLVFCLQPPLKTILKIIQGLALQQSPKHPGLVSRFL